MRDKAEVMSELRGMLVDVFLARENGEHGARIARVHGYVDGYMRALIELGHATREELTELVLVERGRSSAAIRLRSDVLSPAADVA